MANSKGARGNKFTAENIVAILQSAQEGGTIKDIVERSNVEIAAHSVIGWNTEGRKDIKAGNNTAKATFATAWGAVYIKAAMGEHKHAQEMDRALQILKGDENDALWAKISEAIGAMNNG